MKVAPTPSENETPLNLLATPVMEKTETGFRPVMRPVPLFNHSGVIGAEQVKEEWDGNFYTVECVFKAKYSHSYMIEYDQETGQPMYALSMGGRRNGWSNLCKFARKLPNGQIVFSCPEKPFQSKKAAHVANLRQVDLSDKILEVHNCKDGMDAKNSMGWKLFQMEKSEISSWCQESAMSLVHSIMPRMLDQVTLDFFDSLAAFVKEHKIPVLFVEYGDDKDRQYSCGKSGEELLAALKRGEFEAIYAQCSMLQKYNPDYSGEWNPVDCLENTAGVAVELLFTLYLENPTLLREYAEKMSYDKQFPVEEAVVSEEAQADTASPGTKRPCPDA